MDENFIFLFVDPQHQTVWHWIGFNTTTRMKFIAGNMAPHIRDNHGIAFRIKTEDQGSESHAFKVVVGLEEAIDNNPIQTGPIYEGTEENLEWLESLSKERILLILEKAGLPEGYERKMVLVKNRIYGYKEYENTYSGYRERKLFPLKEKIEDGPYLAENHVPRMLFSYNNVILTELLQKI